MQAKVKDITNILEANYPLHLAEDWDNCGLQIGDPRQEVHTIGVALDASPDIIEQSRKARVDLLITHHPLIFSPLKSIDFSRLPGNLIKTMVESNIAIYSAHTNLDSAERGINQYLAEKFKLKEISPLAGAGQIPLIKLVVFAPASHYEKVRQAIFTAGAGHTGQYDSCSFAVRGTGTFRPLEGARPYLGSVNRLEEVDEVRLESVFYESELKQVLAAMLDAHPYEEVAYDLYQLANRGGLFSPGRVGSLEKPVKLKHLAKQVKLYLSIDNLRLVGDPYSLVSRVAVISGSGASFINQLLKQEIDVLITGDLKYHEACMARDNGLSIIDAGHQGTEQVMVDLVADLLRDETGQRGFSCRIISLYEENCMKHY